jgi:hypothetical protein
MNKLKVSLLVGLMAISSAGYGQNESKQEKTERLDAFQVDHREYDIRVGEELKNVGWIMHKGEMLCRYDKGFKKLYIKQDIFDSNKCPNKLIGVKEINEQSGDK